MLLLNLGSTDRESSYGSYKSSKWAKRSIIFARNAKLGMPRLQVKAPGKQAEDKPIEDEIIQ